MVGHEDGVGHALALEQLQHRGRVEVARRGWSWRRSRCPRNVQPMPPMWNIGSGVRLTVSWSKCQSGEESTAAERLRCVVSTPFGTPGRARRVHLHDGVARLAAVPGVDGLVGGEPRLVLPRATAHDPQVLRARRRRELARDRLVNSGPASSSGAPASSTMTASSGGRQPPVQRHRRPRRASRPRTSARPPRAPCGPGARCACPGRRRPRAAPAPAGWSARAAPRRSGAGRRPDGDHVGAAGGLVAEHVRDPEGVSQA